MKALNKNEIYSFEGCTKKQLKEVLNWLKANDICWDIITIKDFKINNENYNLKFFGEDFGFGWAVEEETALIVDLFNDVAAEVDLYEQLEKAKAEVKRLKEAIQEQNKPKVGDWVKCKISQSFRKVKDSSIIGDNWKKITNPQLIKLLEDESKN